MGPWDGNIRLDVAGPFNPQIDGTVAVRIFNHRKYVSRLGHLASSAEDALFLRCLTGGESLTRKPRHTISRYELGPNTAFQRLLSIISRRS